MCRTRSSQPGSLAARLAASSTQRASILHSRSGLKRNPSRSSLAWVASWTSETARNSGDASRISRAPTTCARSPGKKWLALPATSITHRSSRCTWPRRRGACNPIRSRASDTLATKSSKRSSADSDARTRPPMHVLGEKRSSTRNPALRSGAASRRTTLRVIELRRTSTRSLDSRTIWTPWLLRPAGLVVRLSDGWTRWPGWCFRACGCPSAASASRRGVESPRVFRRAHGLRVAGCAGVSRPRSYAASYSAGGT